MIVRGGISRENECAKIAVNVIRNTYRGWDSILRTPERKIENPAVWKMKLRMINEIRELKGQLMGLYSQKAV